MRLWLELGSALVALAFVWAVIETYFLGRTAVPPLRRDAPTGNGPRKYVDAARDHPPGEEGPSPYQRAEGWPASTTRDILDQMAADNAKERTARKRAIARERRPKIARKRDGMSLSTEASADVYRSVFGDDPPAC